MCIHYHRFPLTQVLALHEQSLAPQYRGFPDLALPRSALPSSSLSSSSSSAGASQTEAALPTWHKQVPYMSGHGALIGDGGHMFVLGGVNRHQYTSLRFPLVRSVAP